MTSRTWETLTVLLLLLVGAVTVWAIWPRTSQAVSRDAPYVKRGHYIQLCGDPTSYEVGGEGPFVEVLDSNGVHLAGNPKYRFSDHLWVCGNMLVPGARGPLQAWVDDSVEFDGTR